jgi:methionyl-tRNA formyltransferase
MVLDTNGPRPAVEATLRAVVVGAVGSTEVLLDELGRAAGWDVRLVISLHPHLHGRHSDVVDLSRHASAAGADLLTVARTNDPVTLDAIRLARPDYVFVVGWSQLVGTDFLAIAARGSIGYHPAPLPRLRGRAAIPWTILLEEPISASSLFWIGEGTDDGDLLSQAYFHVARDETARSLYDKHMAALRGLLQDTLPRLAAGEQPRYAQDERHATWATRRTQADGWVDWCADASAIDRLIRAIGRPYPGAFTAIGPQRMTIWAARLVAGAAQHHAMPGQIVSRRDNALTVQTGSGLIELLEWEIESGRAPPMHSVLGRR